MYTSVVFILKSSFWALWGAELTDSFTTAVHWGILRCTTVCLSSWIAQSSQFFQSTQPMKIKILYFCTPECRNTHWKWHKPLDLRGLPESCTGSKPHTSEPRFLTASRAALPSSKLSSACTQRVLLGNCRKWAPHPAHLGPLLLKGTVLKAMN